jgi:thioredoxin 2
MSNGSVILRCTSCRTLNRVHSEKLSAHPLCGQCKASLDFPRAPVAATAATFDREIFDWPEYALLEFWAKWCGYCRMVEPVVNDVAAWHAGRLKVVRVDIDAEPVLARRFAVKATPTFIVFKNGTQVARMDGAPKEKLDLVQWLDQFLK